MNKIFKKLQLKFLFLSIFIFISLVSFYLSKENFNENENKKENKKLYFLNKELEKEKLEKKDPNIFDCYETLEAFCIKECYEKNEDFERCLQDENDKIIECTCAKRNLEYNNSCSKIQISECGTICNTKLQNFNSCKRSNYNNNNFNNDKIKCTCQEIYITNNGN